jgi:aspartate racemase
MEQAFYRERLSEKHGLRVLTPEQADRAIVHRVIYDELCVGHTVESSRDAYRRIMSALVERGAQAIILGCTEISLLVGAGDCSVALFDTTAIHARRAAEWSLGHG